MLSRSYIYSITKQNQMDDGSKQRPHKVPLLLQIRLPDFAQFEGQNGARREQNQKEVPFVMPFTIGIIIYVRCLNNMIKIVQKHVSPFHARSGVFSPGEFDPPSSSAEVFFLKFCKKTP